MGERSFAPILPTIHCRAVNKNLHRSEQQKVCTEGIEAAHHFVLNRWRDWCAGITNGDHQFAFKNIVPVVFDFNTQLPA